MTDVRRFRVPPALAALGVIVVYGTVNVAAPIALSSLGSRHGWEGSRPGAVNLLGLVPLVGGLVVVVLAASAHVAAWRSLDWRFLKVDPGHLLTPEYLVVDGLYRYSRNPLYVGDFAMWTGWATLLGSLYVTAGLIALVVGLQIGVRMEERGLKRQFGAEWRAYKRMTPRFLGRHAWRSGRHSHT